MKRTDPGYLWPTGRANELGKVNHGHHIVMKKANGETAKDYSFPAELNPFTGYKNLVFAPNWNHTGKYAERVFIRLEQVAKMENPLRLIIAELKAIARDFISGKIADD